MIYNLVRRLTVRSRIVGGFTILLVLLFLSLPLVISSNLLLVSRVQQLTDEDIRIDRLLLLASRQTLLARINLQRYASDVVPSPAEALGNLAAGKNSLEEAKVLVKTEEEREEINLIQQSLDEYAQVIYDVQVARAENRQADVTSSIFRAAFLGNDIELKISRVLENSASRVSSANASVLSVTRSRLLSIIVVYSAIFLLALAVGVLLERTITLPVAALQAGAEQFGQTRKPTSIPETGRDELSLLARSFNQISAELAALYQNLENQVADRTRALETSYEQTQAALVRVQEQENRFRAIFQGSNDAIMLLDENGFFDCNDRTLQLFGFGSVGEFVRMTPADVSPPRQTDGQDSAKAAQDRIQSAYQSGNVRFDWIHKRTNGEEFPAEVILSAFDLGDKRVLQATVRDFTERQRAQQVMEKQARELAKVAEISTLAATVLDPDEMLQKVVSLIRDGFGLYHAHIYLLDDVGARLDLVAGAGEVGRVMVNRGWHIPMDAERSLVARAARGRQGVIINDVRSEPDFLPNELLPDTAAEMAVPMLTGDKLIGVLDVQSQQKGIFTSDDVSIQTTLAAQVAVALNNARQYQVSRASEKLIRSIVDATPDWIFVKDLNHRYRMVNDGYAKALRHRPETIIGKNDLELGLSEELVKGNPEKGIRGYWADDDEVVARGETVVIQAEKRVVAGKNRWLNTIKVPLRDEADKVWGVLGFVRDITDRELLRQETEERLAEVNVLYQTVSREGWRSLREQSGFTADFYFDQSGVVTDLGISDDSQITSSMVTVPLRLRGDVLGELSVEVDEENLFSEDDRHLLGEIADQIALAIESARLFTQSQMALGQTETLYSIIAEMNTAASYQEILTALSKRIFLKEADQLLLLGIFDRPLDITSGDAQESMPEWIYPAAYQSRGAIEVAKRYPLSAFQANPNTVFTAQPVVMEDIDNDIRLDRVTRTLFLEVFRAKSSVVIPLLLGSHAIGFVQGYFSKPVGISKAEEHLLTAVAGQAAIVVQSRLLLEQAQSRARQEALIREVTSQVFSATDVDSVMRRAVEQIGRALNMPAFVYLGDSTERRDT